MEDIFGYYHLRYYLSWFEGNVKEEYTDVLIECLDKEYMDFYAGTLDRWIFLLMVENELQGGTQMRLAEAVYRRKSVRKYLGSEIELDILERIKHRIDEIVPLYPDTKMCIATTDFCNMSKFAPYYIGIYTDKSKEAKLNAGYILQQLSIYLTAIGIASCFQARPEVFKKTNSTGLTFSIALAFGYTEQKIYRNKSEIVRMREKDICVIKEQPDKEIEKIVELARISPSSYNSQPWRLVIYNNRVHIFAKKKLMRRLRKMIYVNMGAMLGNVMLGAEELWIDVVLKKMDSLSERKYGDNEYIISLYKEKNL